MPAPLIAIIGRANVGKSTLFNRLTHKRTAIVNDTPGVTRDRIYGRSDWLGRSFMVVDTGGLDFTAKSDIELRVKEQGQLAQEEADGVIFVADKQQGLTPHDREVVAQLRKSGKPMFVAVNKVDDLKHESDIYEFSSLGVEKIYPISAEHGQGVAELIDDIVACLPADREAEETGDVIKIAIIGKPNVGKSSLVNKLLGTERCIVSNKPGTTRDAVDSMLDRDDKKFILVDTAGIRRKGKTSELLEKYSIIMALKAMDRCDIAILMIDGSTGPTDQDATIAGYADERGRGCIIALNKWDLAKNRGISFSEYEKQIKSRLKFLDFAPVIPLSAKTGEEVDRLLPKTAEVFQEYSRNLPTARLNRCFERAIERNPIRGYRGKFVKLFYSTQVKNRPPTFRCFVNHPGGIHFSYKRYLVNSLRKDFGFSGTPLRLIISGKKERN
ncbi:MAG: ribosome biogenesis GTPase Der [Nitrospinota bacterium]|nr:ribosome biogenesis GTPase Der [Nitrospinota bacterium]